MPEPQVIAVRHAKTDVAGRCVGRTDVEPLQSPTDAAQVLNASPEVARLATSCVVWTSPLIRCRGLAEVLAHPRSPRVDERLLEADFGSWEGRSWRDIETSEPAAMTRWMERWQMEGPPGGESAAALEARVRRRSPEHADR